MSFRVAVDARPVDIPFLRRRGIGRFAASLVPELAAVAAERGGELLILRERGSDGGVFSASASAPRSDRVRVVRIPRAPVPERVSDLPDQLLLPIALRRRRADLFHALSMYRLPLRPGVPAVVTMHDVIPLMRPDQLRTGIVHGLLYAAVRRADRVIAVSEAGRRDLVAHLGVPAERVDVVYEAAAPQFVPTDLGNVAARLGIAEPYVLHVGGADPRKNLGALIDAFAAWARERARPERLVLAGPVRDVERAEIEAQVRSTEGRVRHVGFVADADLPALYSGARCLVMPSSYEGFGLPALEALACGTPVAAYDAGALAEVAGPGALLVPDGAMAELLGAVERLCDESELRDRLAAAGRAHAGTFSWRRAAEGTWDAYARARATLAGGI
jgi:glycosyltransferase involved in cell wall biosynthesis